MNIKSIESHDELSGCFKEHSRFFLLLYKSGLEKSDCAFDNLQSIDIDQPGFTVYTADVNQVIDIHPRYNITTVPALLEFDDGVYKNVLKGCHQSDVLKAVFEEAVYSAKMEKEGKTVKSVTVYSTPACSWCTTLKTYLRKHNIRFTDVDISRDPKLGQELVARTGQQGVPQTEINGQWVVGFNQTRINELLEI